MVRVKLAHSARVEIYFRNASDLGIDLQSTSGSYIINCG